MRVRLTVGLRYIRGQVEREGSGTPDLQAVYGDGVAGMPQRPSKVRYPERYPS